MKTLDTPAIQKIYKCIETSTDEIHIRNIKKWVWNLYGQKRIGHNEFKNILHSINHKECELNIDY